MIIDLILDRKDGVPYDAEKFYSDIMGYESEGMSPDRSISAALDNGTNEDVQKALCNYVLWSVNGDRYVAGAEPLTLEEILKTPVCEFINSVNWLEDDEEITECSNKKINEGYLNMTTIPTINTLEDDWYLPEIADDEFNCGIDTNVAPMVGAQDGMALSTMEGGEEDTGLDYLLQMAGVDGTEVTPAEVVATEVPEEEYKYQPVDDIFSIGFENDFDNSLATPSFDMTDDDYDSINTIEEPEVPEVAPTTFDTYDNEIDAFDGIMDTPTEEPVEEPVPAVAEPVETPAEPAIEEPVAEEIPVEEPIEATEETPVEDTATENVEANPEDMVLEKQPEVDDTEAQQIKDYLVHNKEVLFGPASAKVESYKKSLDGKSVEELRVEAEEVSPNWKKYIGKYKVNESVEVKSPFGTKEFELTKLPDGSFELYSIAHGSQNVDKFANAEELDKVLETEWQLTPEKIGLLHAEAEKKAVESEVPAEWEEVEGNGNGLTIKQNKTTGEYAVFRDNEILDDTITDDIQSAEKVLEDESEIFNEDFDKLAGIESDPVEESKEVSGGKKYIISAYKWGEGEDEEGDFYGYFARHPEDPENKSFSYYVNEIEDARKFDSPDEAYNMIERFEDGSELYYHVEEIDDNNPDGTITEDSERLQGTKVEPTDIDLENDGVANVHVFNIQWDCDGADPKDLALPTEVDLTVAHDGSLDIADEIADQLSDDFGFCHYGFDFKVKSLGPDWDESTEDDIEDDIQEEVPAGQQILTEEGEELSDEDMAEIEDNETLEESVEKIEALNVDIEPEEVKVEETTEADLKHEIPENDMIKDNIETGEEIKVDTPVEAENGEIETKEFEVKETTEADLKHEIKDNEPIKDNIDTGEEVKVDEPVEAENADIEVEEKADKFVESYIYSVELADKVVECKSEEEFKNILTENVNTVKSVVII